LPGYVGEILALSGAALFGTLALEMKLGTLAQPGPGLWPFLLCVVIAALGAVAGLAGYQEKIRADFRPAVMYKPVAAALTIGLYAWAMQHAGYMLPTLALTCFWLRVLGGETWRITVSLSVLVTALFYLVFSRLLGVPFPPEFFLV
jgi:hypothetical protein